MKHLDKATHAAAALVLAVLPPGLAHATFPGENGVIVYQSIGTDGKPQIWRMNADGMGDRRLLAVGQNPSVSPNGKKIAYAGKGAALWVMGIDGSNPTVLLPGGDHEIYTSAWSPDGKQLAAFDMSARHAHSTGIDFVDARTGELTGWITTGGLGVTLDWSPRGESIVMTWGWVGQRYWLANNSYWALPNKLFYASFLPDGERLVGTIEEDPRIGCSYTMGVNGENLKLLTCTGEWTAVSPDGSNYVVSREFNQLTAIGSMDGSGAERAAWPGKRHAWSRAPMTPMLTALSNGQWTAPTALAADSDSYATETAIAVMPDNGQMGQALRRALAVGSDGRLVERAQLNNGNWGGWTLVPGIQGNPTGGIRARTVKIAGAQDGSLQAVIVADNGLVYHAMRYANGTWSGFGLLDGASGAPNFAARDVAITIVGSSASSPGAAHVTANGQAEGRVYHRVRYALGNWTPWGLVSADMVQTGSLAIAGLDTSGDVYLLATSPTQGVVRKVRRENGSWTGWVALSNPPGGALKDVSLAVSGSGGADSNAYVSCVDATGKVWYRAIGNPMNDASWSNTASSSTTVMATGGRTVSVGYSSRTGVELVAVQAQPQ